MVLKLSAMLKVPRTAIYAYTLSFCVLAYDIFAFDPNNLLSISRTGSLIVAFGVFFMLIDVQNKIKNKTCPAVSHIIDNNRSTCNESELITQFASRARIAEASLIIIGILKWGYGDLIAGSFT